MARLLQGLIEYRPASRPAEVWKDVATASESIMDDSREIKGVGLNR